jgi:hypothetical protein
VVRALRTGQERILIVRLPDGFQIAVPSWMLDPVFCSQLPQEAKPRIGLTALWQLVELVQAQSLHRRGQHSESGASPSTKGKHAPRQENSLLPAEAGAEQQASVMAEAAPRQPDSLSSTVDPTAAHGSLEYLNATYPLREQS